MFAAADTGDEATIYERLLKKSQPEFDSENPARRVVDPFLGNALFGDQFF